MATSIGGGLSCTIDPDGNGYLHTYVNVELGSLLHVTLDIGLGAHHTNISPIISGDLINGLLFGILTPVFDNLGHLLGSPAPVPGSTDPAHSIINTGPIVVDLGKLLG